MSILMTSSGTYKPTPMACKLKELEPQKQDLCFLPKTSFIVPSNSQPTVFYEDFQRYGCTQKAS